MAILRAGPFASSTDSFLDEPETITVFSPLPVNCAMSDWVNHSWRALKIIAENDDIIRTYEDGPTLEASFDDPGSFVFGFAGIQFMYQAAEDTTFTVTYSADTVTMGSSEFFVDVDGSNVFNDTASPSISGTETIALPATVVPVEVIVGIGVNASGTGMIEVSP
jgi:hypothetical protein